MPQPLQPEGEIVESYVRSDLFSGAVLVAREGRPVFREAYGAANREWEIANAPDTKFRIGSVTKQFTAAAILQLRDRGKLDLDDQISAYYPEAPPAWQAINLRHLLTHTSGLDNYTARDDFPQLSKVDRTPDEIVRLTHDAALEFEPGSNFSYCNTGYILLGLVIERTTGLSYAHYLQEAVFDPLGMHDTGIEESFAIIPRRASGYRRYGELWRNAAAIAMSVPFAAGSIYSTVDDLLIWRRAFEGDRVLGHASRREMTTDHGYEYGFGLRIKRQYDRRLQTHGGGVNGFRATLDHYLDESLTVVVLANFEAALVGEIATELAARQFGIAASTRAARQASS